MSPVLARQAFPGYQNRPVTAGAQNEFEFVGMDILDTLPEWEDCILDKSSACFLHSDMQNEIAVLCAVQLSHSI